MDLRLRVCCCLAFGAAAAAAGGPEALRFLLMVGVDVALVSKARSGCCVIDLIDERLRPFGVGEATTTGVGVGGGEADSRALVLFFFSPHGHTRAPQ
jgi:hypothetical protein